MRKIAAGIMLAIIVLIAMTTLGLAVIHLSGFPFTVDIDYLEISKNTGLSRDEILLNYNAVLNYLSPFSNSEFNLPTLKYSEIGSYHFAQCKVLFNAVYLAGFVSALLLGVLAIRKAVSRETLWISGIITLVIPSILAIAFAADFDRTFTLFHTLFFEGSTWLFDPKVDQIINILPMDFFMHCAYFIALFWLIGAAVQLTISFSNKRKNL